MQNNNVLIHVGDKSIDLSRPLVMAILNVTPDSFYGGSRTFSAGDLAVRIRRIVSEGASVIDIGGYSSRPGAGDVSPEEELRRLSLGISILREEYPDAVVSIDTFRAGVVENVVRRFGPCIVNDISAGELDPAMLSTVARCGVPYIAMHMRGRPAEMQKFASYNNITDEIYDYLSRRIEAARMAGIREIITDPGFGFAKTLEQNYELLSGLGRLKKLGCPVLAGISRKSMIYKALDSSPEEALNGTTALHWECLRQGADILRVHDVAAAAEVVKLFNFYSQHGKLLDDPR